MNSHPGTVEGRADAAELRQELLGRLGVRADAGEQDIEAAHNGLVEFLELAPNDVKSWAATKTADVDEAFALLSGPEADLLATARPAATAQVTLDKASLPPAPPTAPAAPVAPASSAASMVSKLRSQPKALAAVGAVLVLAIIFAVGQMGKSDVPGISGKPTDQQTQAAGGAKATPVDPAKVGALMQKISANPKDTVSLQSLGDLYFASTDYKTAATWEQKILAVDPKNQVALLASGAAQFNLGNAAGAKKQWLIAAALYPKSAEVHYDLGFLYLSSTPPDKVNMQIEWRKVVAIDPNSSLAKTVGNHLKSSSATPTPSAK